MIELNSVASIDSRRSESREPLQEHFDHKNVSTDPPSNAPLQTVSQINQLQQWQPANYKAPVTHATDPINQRQSMTNRPVAIGNSNANAQMVMPTQQRITTQHQLPTEQVGAQGRPSVTSFLNSSQSMSNPNYISSQRARETTNQYFNPRSTNFNTTYKTPRVNPLSTQSNMTLASNAPLPIYSSKTPALEQHRQVSLQSQINQEPSLRALPETGFNDGFDTQFDTSKNYEKNMENHDAAMTSVNEVILKSENQVENDKEMEGETKGKIEKKKVVAEERVSWSPPGSID